MREITYLVQSHSLDLVIETRDARLPLTSINPAFERLLAEQAGRSFGAGPGATGGMAKTKRLIVYNKADLAQDCFQEVRPLPSSSPPRPLARLADASPSPCSLCAELSPSTATTRSSSPTRATTPRSGASCAPPSVRPPPSSPRPSSRSRTL